MIKNDSYYMNLALKEAEKAKRHGDVPVGAIVVSGNIIIGRGHNQVEKKKNPIAHAELIAIEKAVKKIGYKHLLESVIYVTLEPCSMCCGAILLARINRLVFGAQDPKTGAAGSLFNLVQDKRLNHFVDISGGVMQEECSGMLKIFFKELRESKK